MEFSVSLFTSDRGITPAAAAQAAEANGFHAIYVPEHTHIPVQRTTIHPGSGTTELPDDRYQRTLDPWVALATAASVTSTIKLGTSVALPAEHDPITLAKTIASLDFLSGGRVVLGAGFGWNLEEMADHGVGRRQRRTVLREYLGAMRALWSEEEAAYRGEHVNLPPSWAWPKPRQERVPVLLGAFGNEKTFAWIAESADGWITTPGERGLEVTVDLLGKVWKGAGREGRPRVVVLDGRPKEQRLAGWQELGVDEVMYGLPDTDPDGVRAHLESLAATLDPFR